MTSRRIQLSAVAVILFTCFFASGDATTKVSSAPPVANWTFDGCWTQFAKSCRFERFSRLSIGLRSGMPNAIELIVDGYVTLQDRRALDDLRMQRRKLAVDLKALTGFDCRTTIQQIEEDIIVIEAGLARLDVGVTS